jgi:type III pantothenate kinase
MNLIIDQGNTATKMAIFDENDLLIKKVSFEQENVVEIENWIQKEANLIKTIIVSNVTDTVLKTPTVFKIDLTNDTPTPLLNKYETPKTLGKDRLANAVAIWAKNPNLNSLCIDMGTCIKYDLVTAKGEYLGGNISPGMRMRYQALHQMTAHLPQIEPQTFVYGFGTTTASSILNGVQHAIHHEINGFIQRYIHDFGQLTIFMTGGDSIYFEKEFKNTIFADCDVTIYGLNEILKYNVKN